VLPTFGITDDGVHMFLILFLVTAKLEEVDLRCFDLCGKFVESRINEFEPLDDQ
jgi:hypothetical protein